MTRPDPIPRAELGPAALRELVTALEWTTDRLTFYGLQRGDLVAELRRGGVSWQQIGIAAGMTGEGARKRFGEDAVQPDVPR